MTKCVIGSMKRRKRQINRIVQGKQCSCLCNASSHVSKTSVTILARPNQLNWGEMLLTLY